MPTDLIEPDNDELSAWKDHARKWEKRAKENSEKATELETSYNALQKTSQEAIAKAEKYDTEIPALTTKLTELETSSKDAITKAQKYDAEVPGLNTQLLKYTVALASEQPLSKKAFDVYMKMNGTTEEEFKANAETLAGFGAQQSQPKAPGVNIFQGAQDQPKDPAAAQAGGLAQYLFTE